MLDRLPAALRHLLLMLAPAGLGAVLVVLRAITDAGGVLTAVDWGDVLAAAILAVAGLATAALTPLTRQYGIGADGTKVISGEVIASQDYPLSDDPAAD